MGLDIGAFKNVTLIENGAEDDGFLAYVASPEWLSRLAPLIDGQHYDGEERFHVRAGSYGGYNRWREQLAQLAGTGTPKEVWENRGQYDDRPFVELIDFSDCQGVMGSIVCAKLAKDFADNDERAAHFDPNGWFYSQYKLWQRAFEHAAQNGAVVFA